MPRLLHATTEDNHECRLELCEWIQKKVGKNAQFLGIIVWTDEA